MENRKYILSQSLTMLIGELILSAVMVAVFAVLGYYETGVLLGADAAAAADLRHKAQQNGGIFTDAGHLHQLVLVGAEHALQRAEAL